MLNGRGLVAAVVAAAAVLLAAPAAAGATVTAPAGGPNAHDQLVSDFRAAQQVTRGKGVTVAVLSSGVWPQSAVLQGAVTTGPDYVGFGNSMPVLGTLAAGIIAGQDATFTDPVGVIGLAAGAHILAVRVIPDGSEPGANGFFKGDWQSPIVNGIRYAAAHGASVIYLQEQRDLDWSPLDSAIDFALAKGAVVVTWAGAPHDSYLGSSARWFPADLPGVITVGTADTAGKWRPRYSVAYPAVSVLGVGLAADGGSITASDADGGELLATATVAGAAALVKARFPALAPGLVEQAIAESARHYPGGGGLGVVNPAGALSKAAQLAKVRTTAATGPQALAAADHFSSRPPPTIEVVRHSTAVLAGYAGAVVAGIAFLIMAVRLRRRASKP